ncbi:sensor histidine kinase [Myceligenerans crystallogenes]|uniref:histidine kinase n=1 Tax=Myceligenerans crystallogenes TaxID=316335 RepID=A0ABP4ZUL0_9MICO
MSSSPADRSGPVRLLWGAALGTVAWPLDLLLAVAAAGTAWRPAPLGPVAALVRWHRRRTVRFLGWSDDDAALTSRRAAGYLVTRAGIGLVGVLVLGLLAYGLFAVVAGLLSWLFDIRFTVLDPDQAGGLTTGTVLAMVPVGAVLLYLDLMGLYGVGALDRAAAARWLAPSRSERLEARVESLTVSRAELLAALDAERGRIERDLHDGVQQRAVAAGMLVDRARRSVAGAGPSGAALLEQASREVELLVHDLREVAWRVRPTTLDTHGLEPVLRQLADRAAVPTVLDWAVGDAAGRVRPDQAGSPPVRPDPAGSSPVRPDSAGTEGPGAIRPARLPAEVEATVYYVVAEALTNVAKHAGARSAQVRVSVTGDSDGQAGGVGPGRDRPSGGDGRGYGDGTRSGAELARSGAVVRVTITDDGVGGAQARPGHGLAGLAGRVAAAGGTMDVVSPAGGPTRIEVTLPCA